MKWSATIAVVFACLILAGPALSEPVFLGPVTEVSESDSWVAIECAGARVRVSRSGDGLLRVRVTDEPEFESFKSFALRPGLVEQRPGLEDRGGELRLEAGLLTLVIDKATGRMDVLDAEGKPLVTEPPDGGVYFDGDEAGCIKAASPGEHYYGFGEKTGPLDKRGTRMVMWTSDMPHNEKKDPLYQAHPYYMAVNQGRAYGVFFDNTFKSVFDMGAADHDRVRFLAKDGEMNYWVIAGPRPEDVLRRYGDLVGTMPLPPLWGLGNHQCRWSYKTEERVREIRDAFQENRIPVDAIYLDIHYMRGYRVFTFNGDRFPDPAGLVSELEGDGIKTVVIVDPGIKIDPDYHAYVEMMEKRYYVKHEDGGPFKARVWPGKVHFPDFYRPEVRQWWGRMHEFYTDKGIAGIWNDMNEPAGWARDIRVLDYMVPVGDVDWLKMRHGDEMAPHARIRNVYALLENQATYAGLLEQRPDERPFIITRSGYPGVQRYALIWTGDNFSSWGSLQTSIPMILNMGMSGLAFVGADVGGFGGAPSKELFARWVELGIFYPFSRNHTSANMPDQEPWAFGRQITDISRELINTRYRLLPYTYTMFEKSSRVNAPVMRPLVFEFPADERVSAIQDQFMWGDDLMVAPLLKKGRNKRKVYFPQGSWYDFRTGEKYEGPAEVEVDAPLGKPPIFARAGAIIPLAPVMMNTGEKPWDPLTVLVFPAEHPSSFTLYEDDGSSFDYKKGEWARTTFKMTPGERGLEIVVEPVRGSFDPQRETVEFRIMGEEKSAKVSCLTPEGGPLPGSQATCEAGTGAWIVKAPWKKQGMVVKLEER